MELEKFEQKAQQALQGREIKPSAESWEKLESRLTRKKGPSRSYLKWLAGAAAVAAGFFLLDFETGGDPQSEPAVVEEPTPLEEKKPDNHEEILTQVTVTGESSNQSGQRSKGKPVATIRPMGAKSQTGILQAESLSISRVPALVVEENRLRVTQGEINALLDTAMAELQQEQTAVAQAQQAEKLLDQVEFELEESFRHKIFEVLKEGFSKAKTAVANRNH